MPPGLSAGHKKTISAYDAVGSLSPAFTFN